LENCDGRSVEEGAGATEVLLDASCCCSDVVFAFCGRRAITDCSMLASRLSEEGQKKITQKSWAHGAII
jgi:hypothetical protein